MLQDTFRNVYCIPRQDEGSHSIWIGVQLAVVEVAASHFICVTLVFAGVYVRRTSYLTFLRHFHPTWEPALDDGGRVSTRFFREDLVG